MQGKNEQGEIRKKSNFELVLGRPPVGSPLHESLSWQPHQRMPADSMEDEEERASDVAEDIGGPLFA